MPKGYEPARRPKKPQRVTLAYLDRETNQVVASASGWRELEDALYGPLVSRLDRYMERNGLEEKDRFVFHKTYT